MAASKKFCRVESHDVATFNDEVIVLYVGEMEIWDGADLALLRESLSRLIRGDRRRAVGVDMTFVKYIPSGFFGMLFDWWDEGVQVYLFQPQPNVKRMLWFSRFFQPLGDGGYELRPEHDTAMVESDEPEVEEEVDVEDQLAYAAR